MQKIRIVLLGIMLGLIMTINIVSAKAASSGMCGNEIDWSFDKNTSTLEIIGNGDMYDYSESNMPWKSDASKIKSVILSDGITSIGKYAFSECIKLSNITIPNSVTEIGEGAFQNCASLTSIKLPDGITSIGDSVFNGCSNLTNMWLPNSIESVGMSAFQECTKLESITLSNKMVSIPMTMFNNCSNLKNIVIPNNVTSILGSAFNECTALSNITIPNSVSVIQKSAFSRCANLKNIIILNNNTIINDNAIPTTATIYSYENSIAYEYAQENGMAFSSEIPDSFKATIAKTQDKINITITTPTTETEKYVHAAIYDSTGMLIDYKMLPSTKLCGISDIEFNRQDNMEYAKVFLWKSPVTLIPIAEYISLNISN